MKHTEIQKLSEIPEFTGNQNTYATHLEYALKHHREAAKHHEEGNHDKAAQSTLIAQGHHVLAGEHQREDAKHHAWSK